MIDKDIINLCRQYSGKVPITGHIWDEEKPQPTPTHEEAIEYFKKLAAEPRSEPPSKEVLEIYERMKNGDRNAFRH